MRIAMNEKQCPIAANNSSHNLGKCYCFPMPAKNIVYESGIRGLYTVTIYV